MAKALTGIFGPVVTTFDDGSGDLAAGAFRANIRAHIAAGLAGVLIAGTTGEAALLDEDERLRLTELARPLVPDDRWLLVGTGSESTRECVRRTKDAAERGADAVLVVPPHYFGAAMTDDALWAHFSRVADESPVPVLLYNIPKFTHLQLGSKLVHALADHPNIAGIKDSTGDMTQLRAYIDAQSDTFTVLTGHAGTLLDAIGYGARGGMLAVALFAAPIVFDLMDAIARGDGVTASEIQARVRPLARDIVAELGPPGIKVAMDLVGLTGGAPRAPLRPLGAAERERVSTLLGAAGLARVA
ncbi:MAG: dihydrodipicolinate synthase family protein [Gemmatimonadaceae bacterium]|nr:dihydrodipicolinate synthase family protein [Gemmatimonadaceae bacterium]